MIQYMSWKQVKVMGKMTREYLSISLAVMPNILLISFGVTIDWGISLGAGAGGGGHAASSLNLLGKRPEGGGPWELLYLVIVFSRLPPLQCREGSCT